jgi:PD-(D/E)XK nuclease superfamily
MSLNLEAPRELPAGVKHLSHSSINTYLGCPEKWRRRYLDLEYEPTNQKMLVGKVVGRTVATGYIAKMESGAVDAGVLTDVFSDEWRDNTENEEVDWEGEQPGAVKDAAAESLIAYVPYMLGVQPIAVEESFSIRLPETEWDTIGYLDWLDQERVYDLKVSAKTKTQANLDTDPQATLYVAAKQIQHVEKTRSPFRWHAITRPSPKGNRGAFVTELETTRTQFQVNSMLERIAQVAREIDWRVTSGDWQGAAPGYWMCSEKGCGYWNTCRFGGKK